MTCSRCFNPRAHAGRDNVASDAATFDGVSIHAPTRGATAGYVDTAPVDKFQSTRPRGARRRAPAADLDKGGVSIHAPTRGATGFPCTFPDVAKRFNPRAHAGRDGNNVPVLGKALVSIHAPTRGATITNLIRQSPYAVSIHAPTRGATPGRGLGFLWFPLFQSTRPRGARHTRR